MTAHHAIRSCVAAAAAVLCAGAIAVTPMVVNEPSLPDVHVSAIDLTSATVPDPVTFQYIFDTQIPEFEQTVAATYQTQFTDLSQVWSDYFTGMSSVTNWADADTLMTTLNQDVLNWINNINEIGLHFLGNMTVDPVTHEYAPSLCNIITNMAIAGNSWMADLNTGAMTGLDSFDTGFWHAIDGFFGAL